VEGLIFLDICGTSPIVSGDVVMRYSRLISSGFAKHDPVYHKVYVTEVRCSEELQGYQLSITDKGRLLMKAYKSGDDETLRQAFGPLPEGNTPR